jgi:TetR/AcrR family transcriptional repressor of nem operon
MGHSKAEKASSRERILVAAARMLREGGLASLSIVELMKAAGLTHGAFYSHFPSRSALLAAALDRALTDGARAVTDARGDDAFASLVRSYLSGFHRDAVGQGCAIGGLNTEVARTGGEVRDIMRDRLESFVDGTAQMLGDDPGARDRALLVWCTMVGAIGLARLAPDEPLGDDILRVARRFLLSDIERPRPGASGA